MLALFLPRRPESVRTARSAVREALMGFDGELVDTSVLLADELVANAVVHGEGAISLEMDVHDRCVRVAVTDDGPARPVHRPGDAGTDGGRGLSIVDAAATRWGVDTAARGKTVWFELALASR